MKWMIKRLCKSSPHLYQTLAKVYLFVSQKGQCVKGYFRYKKTEFEYRSKNTDNRFHIMWKYRNAYLTDWYQGAGTLNAYFWQDLWGARLIAENMPAKHFDIGSRVDGFIGHLASFRDNIFLIDVRPLENSIPGVTFLQADATGLGGVSNESIESLSALCSLEHFGLGRYGDEVDPDACFKAMKSIVRVLAQGGHAYISVPIGYEHLEFNAHRIFFAETIVNAFKPLHLVEYSCTIGNGIEYNVPIHKYDGEKYNMAGRFGLFHFLKV